ncbi:MAG: hypothetical protein AAB774_00570 [Patescibacteria group bacterium]
MITEVSKAVGNAKKVESMIVELLHTLDRHADLVKKVVGTATFSDKTLPIGGQYRYTILSEDGTVGFYHFDYRGGPCVIGIRHSEEVRDIAKFDDSYKKTSVRVSVREEVQKEVLMKVATFLTAKFKEHNDKTEKEFFAEMRRILKT